MKLPKFLAWLILVSLSFSMVKSVCAAFPTWVDGAGKILSRQTPSSTDPAQSVPAEMKFIPGGAAKIGIDGDAFQSLGLERETDISALVRSYPEKKDVILAPYYIDTTEITNAQWKAYLDATKQEPNDTLIELSWKDGVIPPGQENRPVVCVSYKEAQAYARWALKRLPTEFEWEFAARGAEGKFYPWGDDFDDPDPEARFARDGRKFTPEEIEANREKYAGTKRTLGAERSNCEVTKGKREPMDVGKFLTGASPFGLLDMAGNVWEWTTSPFVPYDSKSTILEVKTSTRKAKYTGRDFNQDKFVIRGGAFNASSRALMAITREGTSPNTYFDSLGFRCARSAKAGMDIVQHAVTEHGSFVFRDTAIDFDRVWGTEHVAYSENGLIAGSKHFMLAPSKHYLKDNKLANLQQLRKAAEGSPLYVGVITTSTPMQNPPLPPGTYAVALFLKNDSMAKAQKDMKFAESGWYWAGMEVGDKDGKGAKPDKKKTEKKVDKKDKKKGAEGEAEEPVEAGPDEDTSAPTDLGYIANPGSVITDRSRDHLVLIDPKTTIVASFPIEDLKEESPLPTLDAKRTIIAADKSKKTPAGEGIDIAYSVNLANKKAVNIKFPLVLPTGAFDAPPPPVAAKAEKAENASDKPAESSDSK